MTPTSCDQSPAMKPVPDSTIITRNATTIASETMPTWSDWSRFQASAHSPGETVWGTSRATGARGFSAGLVAMAVCLT